MTAAAFQPLSAAEPAFGYDLDAARFDESDGAYAVAEPDPFGIPAPVLLRRPSLRAELGAQPAGTFDTLPRSTRPSLPVSDALSTLLPDGLRRGSTVAIDSSVSLLLTLLGASSARGAWIAMVGMPVISAEAATEAGIELARLAIVSRTGTSGTGTSGTRTSGTGTSGTGTSGTGWTGTDWTTAVGALLDAVDVVVARPGGPGGFGAPGGGATASVTDGQARRLSARARGKDAVLVLFGQHTQSWPAVDVRLSAEHGRWTGIGNGYGRLKQRQLLVSATGKGRSARPRSAELWL